MGVLVGDGVEGSFLGGFWVNEWEGTETGEAESVHVQADIVVS